MSDGMHREGWSLAAALGRRPNLPVLPRTAEKEELLSGLDLLEFASRCRGFYGPSFDSDVRDTRTTVLESIAKVITAFGGTLPERGD